MEFEFINPTNETECKTLKLIHKISSTGVDIFTILGKSISEDQLRHELHILMISMISNELEIKKTEKELTEIGVSDAKFNEDQEFKFLSGRLNKIDNTEKIVEIIKRDTDFLIDLGQYSIQEVKNAIQFSMKSFWEQHNKLPTMRMPENGKDVELHAYASMKYIYRYLAILAAILKIKEEETK